MDPTGVGSPMEKGFLGQPVSHGAGSTFSGRVWKLPSFFLLLAWASQLNLLDPGQLPRPEGQLMPVVATLAHETREHPQDHAAWLSHEVAVWGLQEDM